MDVGERISQLEREIRRCKRCKLSDSRTNAVPGEGSLKPKIFFIGEAPGRNEDKQGKPFVGAAGSVLTRLLSSIGLSREVVYITNVVKCRPPGNREPTEEEIEACEPYLREQLSLLKPKLIATLGRVAWKWVCDEFGLQYLPLSHVHGKAFEITTSYGSATVVPLYHPAVAVYNPNRLPLLKSDMAKLKELL